MVKGIELFRKYFESYPKNYVIIGGTACDIIIDEAGLIPRTTKDIDMILVVEALSAEFVNQFWKFIKDADYSTQEKASDQRQYYRFKKPANSDFPYQIELFSKTPDYFVLHNDSHLTPIPVDDDLSSLSAILLNDAYYNYMIEKSNIVEGLHYANIESLICLKAKAYLEIDERIRNGSREDSKQLKKHNSDIFRLTVLLSPESNFDLPELLKTHMRIFTEIIKEELPDKAIFKEMGLGNVDPFRVFVQLKKSFNIS